MLTLLLLCALNAPLGFSATVSPDGTCGPAKGYTCQGSNFGDSCNSYSLCGRDLSYSKLSSGCQPAYGFCYSVGSTSPDGTCGGSQDRFICPGSQFGDSCGPNNRCGRDAGYSVNGCQPAFGFCSVCTMSTASLVSTTTTTTTTIKPTTTTTTTTTIASGTVTSTATTTIPLCRSTELVKVPSFTGNTNSGNRCAPPPFYASQSSSSNPRDPNLCKSTLLLNDNFQFYLEKISNTRPDGTVTQSCYYYVSVPIEQDQATCVRDYPPDELSEGYKRSCAPNQPAARRLVKRTTSVGPSQRFCGAVSTVYSSTTTRTVVSTSTVTGMTVTTTKVSTTNVPSTTVTSTTTSTMA